VSERQQATNENSASEHSYYGQPILKEPVWRWAVPAYFYTGGLAAGSALLAFGGRVIGDAGLARRSRLTALAAMVASAGFLVEDLGRPDRFFNMWRVAKLTSPMSVGSWLLTGFGPAMGIAALSDVTGVATGAGKAADIVAAALAPLVASYTAVLLADTAIPAWHEAGGELPFVFVSGAAASAGGVGIVIGRSEAARRMAVIGAAGQLVTGSAMQRRLGPLAEPYRTGRAGFLSRTAKSLIAGGLLALAVGRRSRPAAAVGGALVAVGSAVERFAIVEAGRQSARDPKYTVARQRARVDAGSA
jgi:hypothetical protein